METSYISANRNSCICKWIDHVKRMDRTGILRMAVELKCEIKRPVGQSRRILFMWVLEDIRKKEKGRGAGGEGEEEELLPLKT
jgi:hypothetical protein